MKKKILSMVVVVAMIFTLMPSVAASAATVKKAKITSVKASATTGKVTIKWKKVKKAKKVSTSAISRDAASKLSKRYSHK